MKWYFFCRSKEANSFLPHCYWGSIKNGKGNFLLSPHSKSWLENKRFPNLNKYVNKRRMYFWNIQTWLEIWGNIKSLHVFLYIFDNFGHFWPTGHDPNDGRNFTYLIDFCRKIALTLNFYWPPPFRRQNSVDRVYLFPDVSLSL